MSKAVSLLTSVALFLFSVLAVAQIALSPQQQIAQRIRENANLSCATVTTLMYSQKLIRRAFSLRRLPSAALGKSSPTGRDGGRMASQFLPLSSGQGEGRS